MKKQEFDSDLKILLKTKPTPMTTYLITGSNLNEVAPAFSYTTKSKDKATPVFGAIKNACHSTSLIKKQVEGERSVSYKEINKHINL